MSDFVFKCFLVGDIRLFLWVEDFDVGDEEIGLVLDSVYCVIFFGLRDFDDLFGCLFVLYCFINLVR